MNELQVTSMNDSAAKVASSFMPAKVAAKAATTGATNASSGSTNSGSTITANDFLTLLVSELKNQDPTQPTDPNSYIQQLVGVNSLQQLIQINQGLTTFENGTSGSSAVNANQ